MNLPTVDSLDIQIKSSADSAVRGVDRLAESVGNLAMKLNAIRGGGLRDFSSGLRDLVNATKGADAGSFSKLATGIKKFENLDSGKLKSVGDALKPLADGIRTLSSAPQIGDMGATVSALRSLSNIDMSRLNISGLSNVAKELSNFANTMSGAAVVNGNVNQMINALARLGSAGGNFSTIAAELPPLSTALRNFITSMSGVSSVSQNTIQLVSALGQLGNTGGKLKTTADNLDYLAQKLKAFMQAMQNAPQVSQNTISLINALGRLNGASVNLGNSMGGGVSRGTSLFANGLKSVGSWLGNGVKRILTFNGALNRFIPGMKKAEDSTNGFVSKIGMFYAKFFLLIRAFKTLGKVVEDAMGSIEVVNYFNAAVGQVTDRADLSKWKELGYDSAESYANSFKEGMIKTTEQMSGYTLNAAGNLVQSGMKNFGIDSSILLNYQAQFAQMASSIGVSSEYSTKISRAMTEIGADLASVKNMDFKDVWDNLSSGLTGKQLLVA